MNFSFDFLGNFWDFSRMFEDFFKLKENWRNKLATLGTRV